jgi:glycosyltransferase involved in cell wall biosynthesis
MRTSSVVICTYNGSAYVTEQLESFSAQSLLPTEVVIVDDCSKDDTIEVVTRFAQTAPFEVRIIKNETNLGYSANFEKGLSLAQGELIFFSDQDDTWVPSKLETFQKYFEQSGEPLVLYSDCNLVGSKLEPLGRTVWESLAINDEVQKIITGPQGFEYSLRRPIIYFGHSMAIPASFRDLVLPMGSGFGHDTWVGTIAAALRNVVLIPQPLVNYRQHTTQVTGNKTPTLSNRLKRQWRGLNIFRDPEYYTRWISEYGVLRQHLKKIGKVDAANLQVLDDKLTYLESTLTMRQRHIPGRLPLLAKEVLSGRYARFSHGWKSVVVDLIP